MRTFPGLLLLLFALLTTSGCIIRAPRYHPGWGRHEPHHHGHHHGRGGDDWGDREHRR